MDPSSQLETMFPPEYRRTKMCSYMKWGIINFTLAAYLFVFLLDFWNDWNYSDSGNCIADLSWWILFYFIIHVVHVIRKIVVIYIWKVAKDPTIACTKVDLISIPVLLLPELGWYIYGNFLLWNSGTMSDCRKNHSYFYWSVVVLIAYGYIFMLIFLLILLSALAVCCYFRIHGGKPT